MLQNSLEQREASPSCGSAPPLSAAPRSLAGAGRGEEAAAAPGPVQAAAVLRGSKANILQGRYFPCSAHAQFKRPLCSSKRASGLLFLMHTVKGKKITVIHLLRAYRQLEFFLLNNQRKDHLFRGSTSWPLPSGPLCQEALVPGEGSYNAQCHWAALPSSLASGHPRATAQAHVGM